MLSRAEIDKWLAHLKSLDRYDPDFDDRCVEALETAQKLGEWLDACTSVVSACSQCRLPNPEEDCPAAVWLGGEGE